MSDNNQIGESAILVIPPFGKTPAISLDMTKTREAEKRLVEVTTVNPMTYADLEHAFGESYRELKRHASTLGYQIAMADKALEQAKADILIDRYPEFMKDRPKSQDNSDMRKAFTMRQTDYIEALDRTSQLKAIESFVDGRIKIMENQSRVIKKSMDLIIRSGLSSQDLYNTIGNKK